MELENSVLHEDVRVHIDKRLKIRLTIYILISVILLAIIIYQIVAYQFDIVFPGSALLIGGVIGIGVSRMFKISWNEDVGKVISNLDTFGFVILVFYIFFEVYREKIVEYFIHGPLVAITSLSLLGGIMIGRVLGIQRKILIEIKENV